MKIPVNKAQVETNVEQVKEDNGVPFKPGIPSIRPRKSPVNFLETVPRKRSLDEEQVQKAPLPRDHP